MTDLSKAPHLIRELRPYQARAAAFATTSGRAILADEMGLGKTAEAIGAALLLAHRARIRKALVLCPSSHVAPWLDEIVRTTDLPAASLDGADAVIGARDPFFVVAPFAAAWRERRELAASPPDLLILDEAWRITRWEGRLGRAILSVRSPYFLVLTGTPFEADLEWLHPLAQSLSPGIVAAPKDHLQRHVRTDDRGGVAGYRHLDELGRRLAPHFLRRRHEEVARELPGVIDSDLFVRGSAGRVAGGPMRERLDALRRPDTAPRIAELHHVLRELALANGHRVVVLARDRELVCAAGEHCERLRVGYACLWNRLTAAEEKEVSRQFLLHPDLRVFLSTDEAVPEAVLRATRHRVCLDVPWSRADFLRRAACEAAPAHRIQLVSRGTAEATLLSWHRSAEGADPSDLLRSAPRELLARLRHGELDAAARRR